tara:strand:- start:5370 stop:5660 length:291 start_codon:yes stop_codon:yes gene_type:complete
MKLLDTIEMASGGIALVLEPRATWEDFPEYANAWSKKLGATNVSKPIISADECLLEVEIDGGLFWISYDDFQASIQLEPKDKKYNEIVLSLRSRLR